MTESQIFFLQLKDMQKANRLFCKGNLDSSFLHHKFFFLHFAH